MRMKCLIRPMKESEYPLLEDFLYEAVFLQEGEKKPPRSITRLPALYAYVRDFGTKKGDLCFCAEVDGRVAGAVWVRLMQGFGFVDDETPELAVALHAPFRGRGLGRAFMMRMLEELKARGWKKVSLSVHRKNPAATLYCRLGFRITREQEEDMVMTFTF